MSYLTHIKDVGVNKHNQMRSLYLCKCGKEKIMLRYAVKSGQSKSCGCLLKENAHKSHSLSKHPLYGVWGSIKSRCYNKNVRSYKNYGENGVRMCDEWKKDFKPFYDWCISNGWRKGLHIDKDIIPKKLGIEANLYSPNTCCIVEPKENNNNRHCHNIVKYKGEEYNHAQIAEKFGLDYRFFVERINRGWSLEDAIHKPHITNMVYEFMGVKKTLKEWSKFCGISHRAFMVRKSRAGHDVSKCILQSFPGLIDDFINNTQSPPPGMVA